LFLRFTDAGLLFTMFSRFIHQLVQVIRMSAPDSLPTWEIFCRVVDNYGDTGVCWRLAKALAAEYGDECNVRLWVDDWATLFRLCPQAVADGVEVAGVRLRRWLVPFPVTDPADVVIEAFACELPEGHLRAMAARAVAPVWINLEYLSAEDWVRGCHKLASPQPDGALKKYFFFPGFDEETGGLIREAGLFGRRDRALAAQTRADWLRARGIAPPDEDALLVSLFSYEQPMLEELLHCWQTGERPLLLLVPEGRVLGSVSAALGVDLAVGSQIRRGALSVAVLPFTDQDGYDELLWRCDLNFVRGEDSFVRAQWAGKPMVWHIYPQEDGAHFAKLEAFLARYRAGLGETASAALGAFWQAWNGQRGGESVAAVWAAFARALPELAQQARSWCDAQGARTSLTTELWRFCRHIGRHIAGKNG
jgi:uncharacterized repeat protein (TIGR03837 family)